MHGEERIIEKSTSEEVLFSWRPKQDSIRAAAGAWSLAVATVHRTVALCRSSFESVLAQKQQNTIRLDGVSLLAPQTGLEPVTPRLTGDRGKNPLFPLPPNSPILLGFLDPVGIMEIENFHYFRAFQIFWYHLLYQSTLKNSDTKTYDQLNFSRRL